jgi:hypothetical protein
MVLWYIVTISSQERTASLFRVIFRCGLMAVWRHIQGTGGDTYRVLVDTYRVLVETHTGYWWRHIRGTGGDTYRVLVETHTGYLWGDTNTDG